ncbi:hypothetical protein FO440_09635 [Mucilaginibacter corticis]|uniref:Uncharacterized protein n=1 Tax=Mucilaginibacter corticis TaxID=2597670 RepID=A0A556MX76_9SPHI|nr:hypothetical protein [Mucilaginibacter corticis]TSJ44418.1 hypothetical protein FO440_09635 [Mucilaginibacter corticis]
MIVNFEIELDGAKFRFHTMNRVRLQLYQVYVQHEGKECRFHVQAGEDGLFKIVGEDVCPKPYQHLESTFNEAIHKLGQVA